MDKGAVVITQEVIQARSKETEGTVGTIDGVGKATVVGYIITTENG